MYVWGEEDVDGIINSCTAGNDLGVVGVEVRVEQLDVSLDGGAIGRQLPQIGAQGLGGGDGVDCGQGHDFLVEWGCVDDIVNLIVPSKR